MSYLKPSHTLIRIISYYILRKLYTCFRMSETTSILDLPTDPIGDAPTGNVQLTAQERPANGEPSLDTANVGGQGQMTLDQSTISQIVSGLQRAAISGATQLPSRDIPMNSGQISTDPQTIPNYVPPPPRVQEGRSKDYIQEYERTEDIIRTYDRNRRTKQTADDIYNEIQIPVLLSFLYFLFQMPVFKRVLLRYMPFLSNLDGNHNMNGLLFTSALFGACFYFITRLSFYFNTF